MENPFKKEEQKERIRHSKERIKTLGFEITEETESKIEFIFNNEKVSFFPYTGWASGKSIKDGRGLKNLIKQIKK